MKLTNKEKMLFCIHTVFAIILGLGLKHITDYFILETLKPNISEIKLSITTVAICLIIIWITVKIITDLFLISIRKIKQEKVKK